MREIELKGHDEFPTIRNGSRRSHEPSEFRGPSGHSWYDTRTYNYNEEARVELPYVPWQSRHMHA